MAELGVSPPTGLFPQPPAPPSQGALSDPTKMMDLFGSALRNQQLQQELKGRAAVGQAAQGALGPGGFDIGAFQNALKNNPDAAYFALPALQEGQNNARTQLDRLSAQEGQLRQVVGSLTGNETPEELRHIFTSAVRGGVDPARAIEVLSTLTGRNKAAIGALYRNMGLDVGAQSQRGTTTPAAGGIPQTAPIPSLNRAGTVATGQAVGEENRQTLAANAAGQLEATSATTRGYHANLENLRDESKILDNLGGPTIEVEKKLNQLSHRLAGMGVTMSTDQLRALENFDKIASLIYQQQTSQFHNTDAGQALAIAANPSSAMSKLGREGVIDMLQGTQDSVDKLRQLWRDSRSKGAVGSSHFDFLDRTFEQSPFDPRVFQFNRLKREDQQKFLDNLSPADLDEFGAKYDASAKRGWVKPLKGSKNEPPATAPATKSGKQSQTEPPIPGARLAADGHWYVRQPHANGDYQRVVMTG